MLWIIGAFIAGILFGIFGFYFMDLRKKPIGTIVVDPTAKQFQLEINDSKAMDKLLYKSDKVVLDVERTARFTASILEE